MASSRWVACGKRGEGGESPPCFTPSEVNSFHAAPVGVLMQNGWRVRLLHVAEFMFVCLEWVVVIFGSVLCRRVSSVYFSMALPATPEAFGSLCTCFMCSISAAPPRYILWQSGQLTAFGPPISAACWNAGPSVVSKGQLRSIRTKSSPAVYRDLQGLKWDSSHFPEYVHVWRRYSTKHSELFLMSTSYSYSYRGDVWKM